MFVKIVSYDDKEREKVEAVYECDRYELRYFPDDATQTWEKDNFLLTLEGSSNITLDLFKKNLGLFFMNNQGRTIDSYRWLT